MPYCRYGQSDADPALNEFERAPTEFGAAAHCSRDIESPARIGPVTEGSVLIVPSGRIASFEWSILPTSA
jgi:hypothetical protein